MVAYALLVTFVLGAVLGGLGLMYAIYKMDDRATKKSLEKLEKSVQQNIDNNIP